MDTEDKSPADRHGRPHGTRSDAEASNEDVLRQRREALAKCAGGKSLALFDPTRPAGHDRGVAASTRLTHEFRKTYRSGAMDISPQDVVDVLVQAGVKRWVLMGLHGYVGYLPDPRATQDVDVLVSYTERRQAVKGICQEWPSLIVRQFSEMVRFCDPGDCDAEGGPRPVIDLMVPWARFQETILKQFVTTDEKTGHRIPRLEAALVAKYAAMISAYRTREKKEYDAGDFRRMVRANYDRIGRDDMRRLADEVREGGGEEIERFLQIAVSDQPFPV